METDPKAPGLNSIAATVNRSLDLGEILDVGLIWLIDDGQKRLVLQTHLGLTDEFAREKGGIEWD